MSSMSYTSGDETGNDSGDGLLMSRKEAILSGTPYTVTKMFPWRLHEMLDRVAQDGNETVVSWLPNGRAFKVHSPEVFVQDIIKTHFKQSKFKSFQRQLNLWGFERSKKGSPFERGSYFHPLFVRGRKDLCQHMARQKIKGATLESKKAKESSSHPLHQGKSSLKIQGTSAAVAPASSASQVDSISSTTTTTLLAPTFTHAATTANSASTTTASLPRIDSALLREIFGSDGSLPNSTSSTSSSSLPNGVDFASILLSANPTLLQQVSQYQQLTNMLYSARLQANAELINAIRARDALEAFVANQSPIVPGTGSTSGRPTPPPPAVTSTSGSSATGGSSTSTSGTRGGAPSSESEEPATSSSSGGGAPSCSESEERTSSINSSGGAPSSEEEEPTTSTSSSNGDATTSEDDEEESSSTP